MHAVQSAEDMVDFMNNQIPRQLRNLKFDSTNGSHLSG